MWLGFGRGGLGGPRVLKQIVNFSRNTNKLLLTLTGQVPWKSRFKFDPFNHTRRHRRNGMELPYILQEHILLNRKY